MNEMFYMCNNLTSLDLSMIDTRNGISCNYMLYYVPSICTIYINPDTFINIKTNKTFTPSELGWKGAAFTPKINDENNTEA